MNKFLSRTKKKEFEKIWKNSTDLNGSRHISQLFHYNLTTIKSTSFLNELAENQKKGQKYFTVLKSKWDSLNFFFALWVTTTADTVGLQKVWWKWQCKTRSKIKSFEVVRITYLSMFFETHVYFYK